MRHARLWASLLAALILLVLPKPADCALVRGKVQLEDGSPPNKVAGIERLCQTGSRQVAVADRKGMFLLTIDIDPLSELSCVLQAHLDGYESSVIEISSFNWLSDPNLPPLVLRPRGQGSVNSDNTVLFEQSGVPLEARTAWDGAARAARVANWTQAERQLRTVVKAAPGFARGWYGLGYARAQLHQPMEAQEALRRAVERNPKMLDAYLLLARVSNEARDWQGAADAAGGLIRGDAKKRYPEIYSHLALARYQLKDLDGAQASIEEGIRLDQKRTFPRNEYILGVILKAKQNYDGAREHLSKYLELVPKAPDAEVVKAALAHLGKTEAAGDELVLEAPRENPVSAEGEAWVPGGVKALAAIAHLEPVPSYPQFFSQ